MANLIIPNIGTTQDYWTFRPVYEAQSTFHYSSKTRG